MKNPVLPFNPYVTIRCCARPWNTYMDLECKTDAELEAAHELAAQLADRYEEEIEVLDCNGNTIYEPASQATTVNVPEMPKILTCWGVNRRQAFILGRTEIGYGANDSEAVADLLRNLGITPA